MVLEGFIVVIPRKAGGWAAMKQIQKPRASMVKNKLQELDEILAKSQRLASNIGDTSFSSRPLNYRVGD